MSEPTPSSTPSGPAGGAAPQGPASGYGSGGGRHAAPGDSSAPTAQIPGTSAYRAEGPSGGVSTAHSGQAAGDAAPTPSYRRGPVQSVLVLKRIDPWTTFTTVLALAFALFVVWMVVVGVVYLLLSGMGVWDRLGGLLSGVAGDATASAIDAKQIFLYAGGVGLLDVLLFSVLATLGVFIYNIAASLTGGGIQVTLADRDEHRR